MRKLTIFVVFWQVLVKIFKVPNYIIPDPISILKAIVANFKILLTHTMYTLVEALIGLLIAIVLAIMLAVIFDKNTKLKQSFMQIFAIVQTIPLIIMAPIFLIWFGFGISSKIILVVSICLFPILVNLLEGFSQIEAEYLDLMQVMQSSSRQVYLKLKIPGSIPYFFSGLKIAITYSISGAVAAEYVGSNHGLGIYMSRSLTNFDYDMIFAITIIVCSLTIILLKLLTLVSNKYNWKENDEI